MIALGLLILRIVIGLTMAAHGAQKAFGWWGGTGINGWLGGMNRMRMRPALLWGWMSVLAELLGGLGFGLGILFPLPGFAILAAMLVAVALVHWPKGFWNSKGGFEFNLSIIAAAVALSVTGPGQYSVDSALGIHLPEPLTFIVVAVVTLASVALALTTRGAPAAEAKPQAPA